MEWMTITAKRLADVSEADLERLLQRSASLTLAETVASRARSRRRADGSRTSWSRATWPVDPTARLKGGRRGRTLPKPLGEDEIVKLLDSIPRRHSTDLRDRALLELLYGTGARVSEVVGIGSLRSRLRRGVDPFDRKGNRSSVSFRWVRR
jgi:integrase/recombinase XerD